MDPRDYPIFLERARPEDGDGFLAFAPDLPGCMSDGGTEEEAVRNVRDAINCWIEQVHEMGRAVPNPSHQMARG
jgi:antitoxin HicB